MMSIGTFLGIASLLFTGFTSYENKRSNDISRLNSQKNEQRDKAKETVIAITKFSNKVIPALRKPNLSLRESTHIIAYISRWQVYIDEGLVNNDIIKDNLGPYLKYISDTFGTAVLRLSKTNPQALTGYINLMDNFRLNPL